MWSWIVGLVLAFFPLYILGFMGATRRLDHYDASLGWQGLFIVAGIGAAIIVLGFVLQLVQLVISVRNRRATRDITGDPWDGRTLEWTTASPPPAYNFAVIPRIVARDQFWADKESGTVRKKEYEDIRMPKNSGLGIGIAAFAFCFGFAVIWHMLWLLIFALFGALYLVLERVFMDEEETEEFLSAEDVRRLETV